MRILLLILVLLAPMSAAESRVPRSQAEISLSFAPLVREAAPAVVNIYARRITRSRRTSFMNDPFFDRFFEDFGQPEPRAQNSLGSGVILSPDGLAVTNFHVVGAATEIRVVLNDRREFDAEILLSDAESDLAILKLAGASDLPSLPLRDSDSVEVGELVLAIGNPFGVGQTVSSGIVSGLARSGGARGSERGYFIQTDAPINPGNSGGALIDIRGRLIGINTRIVTRSGGSNGIGFAIPANLVKAFMDQARDGRGRFERPWAGLSGQSVNQDIAETLGLGIPEGVVITGLHPESPFARTGFEVGDVITAVEGVPVNSPAELVYRMSVAQEIDVLVDYVRQGDRGSVLVTMAPPVDDPPRAATELQRDTVLPGLHLVRINPAVIAEYDLPLEASGVLVIDPGRLGARVGLRPGDVIRLINGSRVETPEMVRAALSRPGRFRLSVLRGNGRVVLSFRT